MTTMTVAQIRRELFNNENMYAKINGVQYSNAKARAFLYSLDNQDEVLEVEDNGYFFEIKEVGAEAEQPEAERAEIEVVANERTVPSSGLLVGTAPESSLPAVLLQPQTVDADASLERANFDRSCFWNMQRHEQPKAQFDMELQLYKKWDELLKLGGWWAMQCTQGIFYLVVNASEFRCFVVSDAGEKLLSDREYYEAFYFFQVVCSRGNMHLEFKPFAGQIWYEYTRAKPCDVLDTTTPISAVVGWVNYDHLETPEQVHAFLEISENRQNVQDEFLDVELPIEMLYSNAKHYFKNPRRAGQRIVVLDCAK